MYKKGDLVYVGKFEGTIIKVLKKGKYRVKLEFAIGARNWDFEEDKIKNKVR
jgi:translation initiation factor IF-1